MRKGFSVRQLLNFCIHAEKTLGLKSFVRCTTEDIAREIVIPETMTTPEQCYMESHFMREIGGCRCAKKLVSHAWKCRFVDTVSNILRDAAGIEGAALDLIEQYRSGIGDAEFLLDQLPYIGLSIIDATYWLDMFAINQHKAICGDCWACRDEGTNKRKKGDVLTSLELIQLSCKHGVKRNPCRCGTRKFDKKDPRREVPRIVDVVERIGEVIVSLDADLATFRRLWVIKEIVHALLAETCEIRFQMPETLSKQAMERVSSGEELIPSVEDLEVAKADEVDKELILGRIRDQPGGVSSFDELSRCMVEMQFGRMNRLLTICCDAQKVISRLRTLVIDCSWARKVTSLSELGSWSHGLGMLQQLQQLDINFCDCSRLASIDPLGDGLIALQQLDSLSIDFTGCSQLVDVNALGDGMSKLGDLQQLFMSFSGCEQLVDVSALGKAVEGMPKLKLFEINCSDCPRLTIAERRFLSKVQFLKALASQPSE